MKRAVERAPSRVAPEAAASHTSLCVTHQSLKRQYWNLGRGTWVLTRNLVSEQALRYPRNPGFDRMPLIAMQSL